MASNKLARIDRNRGAVQPVDRSVSNLDNLSNYTAALDRKTTELNLHRADLRKHEMLQLLNNVDEVTEEALRLAGGDPAKMQVYGQIVNAFTQMEAQVYGNHHAPQRGTD